MSTRTLNHYAVSVNRDGCRVGWMAWAYREMTKELDTASKFPDYAEAEVAIRDYSKDFVGAELCVVAIVETQTKSFKVKTHGN